MSHIIDILPTYLDAAGVDFPSSFSGRNPAVPDGGSLMDVVKGAEVMDDPLFWEHHGSRAVYQEDWKLIADGETTPWELYNLADDPTEQRDLTSQFSEHADLMKEVWHSWAQKNSVLPLQSGEAEERLESWGQRESNGK